MLHRASYFQLLSLGVSSGDETLRLMLDMWLENTFEPFPNSVISQALFYNEALYYLHERRHEIQIFKLKNTNLSSCD